MKAKLLLSALLLAGGLGAVTAEAPMHPAAAKPAAKSTPMPFVAPAGSKRGPIGGPNKKPSGINGTGGHK